MATAGSHTSPGVTVTVRDPAAYLEKPKLEVLAGAAWGQEGGREGMDGAPPGPSTAKSCGFTWVRWRLWKVSPQKRRSEGLLTALGASWAMRSVGTEGRAVGGQQWRDVVSGDRAVRQVQKVPRGTAAPL